MIRPTPLFLYRFTLVLLLLALLVTGWQYRQARRELAQERETRARALRNALDNAANIGPNRATDDYRALFALECRETERLHEENDALAAMLEALQRTRQSNAEMTGTNR